MFLRKSISTFAMSHTITPNQSPGDAVDSRRSSVLIVNPVAGGGKGATWLESLRGGAHRLGLRLEVTERTGHAEDIARGAVAGGCPLVVAGGGDDTVREVVRGLLGSDAHLAIVPLGTFNNFARSLDLPLHPLRALEALVSGRSRAVDLGRLGDGTVFTESVGVGFDADAWRRAPRPEPPGLWRLLTGARAGLDSLAVFVPGRYRVTLDEETMNLEATQITVANTRYFASGIEIAPKARSDDGLLDICIIPPTTRWQFLAMAPVVLAGLHVDRIPEVRYRRSRTVIIEADEDQPVRVDGAVQATLPVAIEVMKGAIRVRIPGNALTAEEIMTSPAVTIPEDAPVQQVADLIADKDVSGVVVVDSDGEAVGVISRGDLLHRVAHPHLPPHVQILGGVFYLETPHRLDELINKMRGVRARDIMSDELVWVSPDTSAQEVADLMIERDVRRIPVLRDGKPVGVITRGDVVRHCVARRQAQEQ